MNQKRNKSKKTNEIFSKKVLVRNFVIVLILAIFGTVGSYLSFQKNNSAITTEQASNENPKTDDLKLFQEKKLEQYFENINSKNLDSEKFEEYTKEFEKNIIENGNNEDIAKKTEDLKNKPSKLGNVNPASDRDLITSKDTYTWDKKSKPKIAIIIDDVSSKAEKDEILNLGYKTTMAFLPPTKDHPISHKIAYDLPVHMIHFPMQASSAFKGPEINTLSIDDSYETIENRVKQLREWYPNAVYTNNHTGSVFTGNDEAMDKLFRALKKYNFIFVDSRTSPKSAAKKCAVKYGMPYIVRNVFLDNDRNYKAIETQLKTTIEIAKKTGYAVAIGHPHEITLKVLKNSKHLLDDLEPIYVNELPYLK